MTTSGSAERADMSLRPRPGETAEDTLARVVAVAAATKRDLRIRKYASEVTLLDGDDLALVLDSDQTRWLADELADYRSEQ